MSSPLIENHPALRNETVIPISAVPNHLPGGTVNPSTVQRWMRRGVSGVQLESFLVGLKRFTSTEALERFLIRINGGDPQGTASELPKYSMPNRDGEAARKRFNLPAAGRNGQPAR